MLDDKEMEGWRQPQSKATGNKVHTSVRGERHLPNNKINKIYFFTLSPNTPPSMKFIWGRRGMGRSALHYTSIAPPGLEHCSVQLSNRQTAKLSIHWEIQSMEASILGGVPPAPNPGIEGQILRGVNPGWRPYNDIGVRVCTTILWTRWTCHPPRWIWGRWVAWWELKEQTNSSLESMGSRKTF